MNDFIGVINSVGFPVAACVALFYINQKNEESHKETDSALVKALQENTLVIQRLYDALTSKGGE